MRGTLAKRLMAKVVVDTTTGCWNWTGSTRDGYGQIWTSLDANRQRQNLATHRVSWEIARGPIPDDLELDHLCRVRRCVNPDHLELVTHRVNVLRGDCPAAVNARKVQCGRGHALRSYPGTTKRYCPTCRSARLKASRLAKRAS